MIAPRPGEIVNYCQLTIPPGMDPRVKLELIRRPSLLKILAVLEDSGELTTRGLLTAVNADWRRIHGNLNWLAAHGLVNRRPDGKYVYNSISPLGLQVLRELRAEGLAPAKGRFRAEEDAEAV